MVIQIGLAIILSMMAGFANAVMDTYAHHYDNSVFKYTKSLFFAKDSWRNKYKNGNKEDGEKFLFSTTILCFLTDVWHLSKFVFLTCLVSGSVIVGSISITPYYIVNLLIGYVLVRVFCGVTFQIFYGRILILKKE